MGRKKEIEDRITHLHGTLDLIDIRTNNILQELQELRKEKVRINFEENLLPVFEGCEAKISYLSGSSSCTLKFQFESLNDKNLSEFKDFIESNDGTDSSSEVFLNSGSIRLFYRERGDKKRDHVTVTINLDSFESLKTILESKFSSVKFLNVDDKIGGKSESISSKADSIKRVEKERRRLEILDEEDLL